MSLRFPTDKFEAIRTPFYYYDTALLRDTLNAVAAETSRYDDFIVHYAIKANANPKLLKIISGHGFGADCVSGGEIQVALDNGFDASKIVFAGVGKSDWEIKLALNAGISCFNVESIEELVVINDLASACQKRANVALRVNPNVGAHTHANITTGLDENKFGIAYDHIIDAIRRAQAMNNVSFCGLHFHIGSQITDMQDFVALCKRINDLLRMLDEHGISIESLNVGGGLGVDYVRPDEALMPDFQSYFGTYARHLKLRERQKLHFELGRAIVAQCGTLITRVLYVKNGATKKFVIVDAGMTDLIRPALYGAVHKIENLCSNAPIECYDVVGPICESTDVFAKNIELNGCSRGDLIAIRTAGAYGEAMASSYNCRQLPQGYVTEEIK